MSRWTDFRTKNPVAAKVAIGVGITVITMLMLFGLWNVARAQAKVDLACGSGASWAWSQSTSTLTCVPNPTSPPPVDPPPTTGDRFAGCAGISPPPVKIDGQWGNLAIQTNLFAPSFTNNILSVRLDVPLTFTGTTGRTSSWVPYQTAGAIRQAVLSTVACDFSSANALKSSTGAPFRTSGDWGTFSFRYKAGPATTTVASFVPGGVYFINVVNQYASGQSSCINVPDCDLRGGLPK